MLGSSEYGQARSGWVSKIGRVRVPGASKGETGKRYDGVSRGCDGPTMIMGIAHYFLMRVGSDAL